MRATPTKLGELVMGRTIKICSRSERTNLTIKMVLRHVLSGLPLHVRWALRCRCPFPVSSALWEHCQSPQWTCTSPLSIQTSCPSCTLYNTQLHGLSNIFRNLYENISAQATDAKSAKWNLNYYFFIKFICVEFFYQICTGFKRVLKFTCNCIAHKWVPFREFDVIN